MRFGNIIIILLMLYITVHSASVSACATCLCGDPTITTMGTSKPFAGRMRAGIEYLTRGEKGAIPGVNDFETREERVTYIFSYAPSANWILAISLPMVTKKVDRFDLSSQQGSGEGDIDLSARWVLGKDREFASRYLWGLQFGLRVPNSTEQSADTQMIDIDAQPGIGATVPSIGAWYGRYVNPWFFYASLVAQHATSEGYQNYQAGDVVLLTGLAQYGIANSLALQFSIDSRFKKYDYYDGERDDNSGGVLVMGSPGLGWTPIEDLLLNIQYQIPIVEHPHGYQEEEPTLRWGISYDF